jgi:hypothetical protein
MKMTTVESSSVGAIGYDEATKALHVQFVNGTVYAYEDVPADLHRELMDSESKGKFFAQKIRNHFTGKKLEESAA